MYLPAYRSASTKRDKAKVIEALMNEIWGSGGRFLKEDHPAPGLWSEIEDRYVREKVGRALRDASKKVPDRLELPRRHKGDQKRDALALQTDGIKRRVGSGGTHSRDANQLSDWHESARSSCYDRSTPSLAFQDSTVAACAAERPNEEDPRYHESIAIVSAVASADHNIQATASLDAEDPFMCKIDSVLGPMSPGGLDPLEKLLDDKKTLT
jgi:hypothetical protein